MSAEARLLPQRIAEELGARPDIDVAEEVNRRSAFLADLLAMTDRRTLVIAVSGGVDSAAVGMLCRRAVERRPAGSSAVATVRLPYRRQKDEADAELVVETIAPEHRFTVDVQPASDAIMSSLTAAGLQFSSAESRDHAQGNIKARRPWWPSTRSPRR